MAKKTVAKKSITTPTPHEKARAGFQIRTGREIPPVVHESKYPWGELAQAFERDSEDHPSFFLPCDSQDQANSRRSAIQGSGRHYYTMRRMPYTVLSRVVEEDGVFGVESWIVPSTE